MEPKANSCPGRQGADKIMDFQMGKDHTFFEDILPGDNLGSIDNLLSQGILNLSMLADGVELKFTVGQQDQTVNITMAELLKQMIATQNG